VVGHTTGMRDWLVAGAVIEGPTGVLLVENRRRNGTTDWSPPGGVIDPGEAVIEGLAREVREETGLVVHDWSETIYEIEVAAPDLGWRLRVEAFRAIAWSGDLVVDDPDGIVVDARFVALELCGGHLEGGYPWVGEPLVEWLAGPWEGRRSFGYDVVGSDLATLAVTRR
jgi:8-oxo-dGTP diphosphatase